MLFLVYISLVTGFGIALANDCETIHGGTCLNLFFESCKSGEKYSLNGCGFLKHCCYSEGGTGVTSHTPVIAPPGSCGVSSVRSGSFRVVGGRPALVGEFPWQVSLQSHGHHVCGGTLIDHQWVLTAGHCLHDMNPDDHWSVVVGDHDRHHTEGHEYRVYASKLIRHKDYVHRTMHNDIALIKLRYPVSYNKYISPACLPTPHEDFDGMYCTVSGWGALSDETHSVSLLHTVDVPVISNSACGYKYFLQIYSSNICAGLNSGGKDSCHGDSGGPLVCKVHGVWRLAGIVSWGHGCAEANKPGVYTRVTSFLDWIADHKV